MHLHSKLWWLIARWRVRSRLAYAAKYLRKTGQRPVGRHRIPLLGFCGLVGDVRTFKPLQPLRPSKPTPKLQGKYDVRLVRAYLAALGHYVAADPKDR